jgi:hypothetical protein
MDVGGRDERAKGAKGTYDILVFLRVVSNFGDKDGAAGLLAFLVLACRLGQPAQTYTPRIKL